MPRVVDITLGGSITSWVEIRDDQNELIDPAALSLRRMRPNGSEEAVVSIAGLVRTGVGKYEYTWVPSIEGAWAVRWEATNPTRAIEANFNVDPSQFS